MSQALTVTDPGAPAFCQCGEVRLIPPGMTGPCLACAAFAALSAAQASGATLGPAEFARLCLGAGRIHGPALLLDAWHRGIIAPAVITAEIGNAWSAAEYPERAIGRPQWLELFSVAGYTLGGQSTARPAAPVRLWRGSPAARRRGMAWTADPEVARQFANSGFRGRPPGVLYETVAPPSSLLCRPGGRAESEYVVNPRRLVIREPIKNY
jgi:hypothetical protein